VNRKTKFHRGDLVECNYRLAGDKGHRRAILLRPKYANKGLIKMWRIWDITNNIFDIVHYPSLEVYWVIVQRADKKSRKSLDALEKSASVE
jgi:hypothetical protein